MGQRLLLPFPLWGKGQGERGQWILPTVTGMACRCLCTMYKVTGMACRCPCTIDKVTGIDGLLDGLNRYLNTAIKFLLMDTYSSMFDMVASPLSI